MSRFDTSQNWPIAKTVFAFTQISFSSCISRSVHFFIGPVKSFVPPADFVQFGEDYAFFALHVVVDVCFVSWVDEFSSGGKSVAILQMRCEPMDVRERKLTSWTRSKPRHSLFAPEL